MSFLQIICFFKELIEIIPYITTPLGGILFIFSIIGFLLSSEKQLLEKRTKRIQSSSVDPSKFKNIEWNEATMKAYYEGNKKLQKELIKLEEQRIPEEIKLRKYWLRITLIIGIIFIIPLVLIILKNDMPGQIPETQMAIDSSVSDSVKVRPLQGLDNVDKPESNADNKIITEATNDNFKKSKSGSPEQFASTNTINWKRALYKIDPDDHLKIRGNIDNFNKESRYWLCLMDMDFIWPLSPVSNSVFEKDIVLFKDEKLIRTSRLQLKLLMIDEQNHERFHTWKVEEGNNSALGNNLTNSKTIHETIIEFKKEYGNNR